MLYLVIALLLLGIVTAGLHLFAKSRGRESAVIQPTTTDCSSCDGSWASCEQECMLTASTKPIEYFEDEELDTYAGKPSDAYTDEETEQFAEVLETLRPEEVKAWSRSLILRGINMPDGIKDEFVELAG